MLFFGTLSPDADGILCRARTHIQDIVKKAETVILGNKKRPPEIRRGAVNDAGRRALDDAAQPPAALKRSAVRAGSDKRGTRKCLRFRGESPPGCHSLPTRSTPHTNIIPEIFNKINALRSKAADSFLFSLFSFHRKKSRRGTERKVKNEERRVKRTKRKSH